MSDSEPAVRLLSPDGERLADGRYDIDVSDAALRDLYRDMVLVRRLDVEGTALQRQGELALWAPCLGQEAAQIGSARCLRPTDMAFPTYRDHGVAWARGVTPLQLLGLYRGVTNGGWDPTQLHCALYSIVIGSQALHAAGYALGASLQGSSDATVAYFGDGATDEGDVRVLEAQLARTVDAIGQAGTRCRGLLQRLQTRTDALAPGAPPGSGDLRMRRAKTSAAMRRFAAAVDAFQRAQAQNRREHRAAVARQYRVMRPNADDAEVADVEDAVGAMTLSQQQVFALGTRGDPRAVLADMRARRDDVMALERGIDNLARLFADMENMLAAQGAQLDSLEAQVDATLEYTEAARGDLRRARETQRNIKKVRECIAE